MKLLYFALFVTLAAAVPSRKSDQGPVEVIVNGVPEGQALDIEDLVSVKVQEKVDGEVASASDPLHPFSAAGIAEVAAAAAATLDVVPEVPTAEIQVPTPVITIPGPESVVVIPGIEELDTESAKPAPAVLPSPVLPEVIAVETSPVAPVPVVEIPEAKPEPSIEGVVIPDVAISPEAAVIPVAPIRPEVPVAPAVEEAVAQPNQAQTGEIYNDGTVQISLNVNEETGVLSTLSSWVGLVMTYINNGVQYTQQLL